MFGEHDWDVTERKFLIQNKREGISSLIVLLLFRSGLCIKTSLGSRAFYLAKFSQLAILKAENRILCRKFVTKTKKLCQILTNILFVCQYFSIFDSYIVK